MEHTGISSDFEVMEVNSEVSTCSEDLEWDHSADVSVKPSTSWSKPDDDRSA